MSSCPRTTTLVRRLGRGQGCAGKAAQGLSWGCSRCELPPREGQGPSPAPGGDTPRRAVLGGGRCSHTVGADAPFPGRGTACGRLCGLGGTHQPSAPPSGQAAGPWGRL